MSRVQDRTHVFPNAEEHNTNGPRCWCEPTYQKLCDACDGEAQPDCWKCGGKWLIAATDMRDAMVVIHRKRGE